MSVIWKFEIPSPGEKSALTAKREFVKPLYVLNGFLYCEMGEEKTDEIVVIVTGTGWDYTGYEAVGAYTVGPFVWHVLWRR